MTSSTSRTPTTLGNEQQRQYQRLCILHRAVNEVCKTRSDVKYASGDSCSDASLTDYQKFLCKLAQVCDSEKRGGTVTALVVLKGTKGPEYLFVSNMRKRIELERTKTFLNQLLGYVGENPDKLGVKPLQKIVLGRILEFNCLRLSEYLNSVVSSLTNCIQVSVSSSLNGEVSDVITQLTALRDLARFPRDIGASNDNMKKFLCDFDILIKAIHSGQNEIDTAMNKYIHHRDPEISSHWCELRHYLGRLHSFRQASEVIVDASKRWNELFTSFTVDFICSSPSRRLPSPENLFSSTEDLIQDTFPNYRSLLHSMYIAELRALGLDNEVLEQKELMPAKTQVHCEVNMHHRLVKQGKTQPCDFWHEAMFIATSKPTCRLCYYYFQDEENEFQVQPPHMNLYPKWRLPDVLQPEDEAAIERHNELMNDILEQFQIDTLKIMRKMLPQWKSKDSRTDSRIIRLADREEAGSTSSDSASRMSYSPSSLAEDGYLRI
ncbi:hypothetical protein BGZ63DRAFT_425661 [Mariannaea sp. PMI_226]|nr:hypothetical protein BGZ63DRAFT_425661 [Mariannaea sp. PMI_226]